MKKLKYNFLFSAIALTGAFAFASCSSSEDETQAEVNPTYDGQSVKTQFAINIGSVGGSNTRMTSEATQTDGNFLGINNIKLLSFTDASASSTTPTFSGTSTTIAKVTELGNFNNTDYTKGTKEYKIYYDVEIPENTYHFLLYGMGPQGTDHASYMSNGIITAKYSDDTQTNKYPSTQVSFEPVIITEPSQTKVTNKVSTWSVSEKKAALEYIMKQVSLVNVEYKENNDTKYAYWSELSKDQTLGKLFYEFIGAEPTDASPSPKNPLAGSSVGALGNIQTLYNKVFPHATSTDKLQKYSNVTRGQMARAILRAINTMKLSSDASSPKAFAMSTTTTKIKNTDKSTTESEEEFPNSVIGWFTGDDGADSDPQYPEYLPNGAVQYKWTADQINTGAVQTYSPSYSVTTIGSSANYIDVSSIIYPPSLAYFCDTPVKANTSGTISWPATASKWQGEESGSNDNYDWTGWDCYVSKNTTTVALRNSVKYGVAKMETTVKVATEEGKTGLLDKTGETQIAVPTKGFKVTGILIGGQPSKSDWQYLPASDSKEYTVYENFGKDSLFVTKDNATGKNYCLLFDNYTSSGQSQKKVKIALELENNASQSFEGHDGLVARGQKFYLIGELDPSKASSSVTVSWPSNEDAKKGFPQNNVNRVFIQDHTTVVNLTFKNLANAYVNIPDLRTTQLVLGLSVDLAWKTGLEFDVEVGASETAATE